MEKRFADLIATATEALGDSLLVSKVNPVHGNCVAIVPRNDVHAKRRVLKFPLVIVRGVLPDQESYTASGRRGNNLQGFKTHSKISYPKDAFSTR